MSLAKPLFPSPGVGEGPTLYCGDTHGNVKHILRVARELNASAVILLGDFDAKAPLDQLLAPIADIIWWIPGNHDTDSVSNFENVFESSLASRNIHGRVVQLPDGTRVGGLGGVFRGSVWDPKESGGPRYRRQEEHARATPRQDRWRDSVHRRHWSSIYPDIFDRLASQRADVLVTHEAPGYHPHGFQVLDALAHSLGAKVTVHGHHHDALDSSAHWSQQGFRSYGVGLRGITSIDAAGVATVVVPGELDDARALYRQL